MTADESPFRWQSESSTHIGTVRKVNEDSYLDLARLGLWVVADGMGGHAAGDVASRMIVDSFRDLAPPQNRQGFLDELLSRLQSVNGALRNYAAERPGDAVVGSTVALMVGYRKYCTCLWAGDSRIYLLRDRQLRQVTRDHSQVEELVNLGLMDRADAESHPASNIVTRAVGATDSLAVDMVSHEFHGDDIYLICSDGLNKAVSDDEITEILQNGGGRGMAESLIDRALDHGATDNVTAVVVRIEA